MSWSALISRVKQILQTKNESKRTVNAGKDDGELYYMMSIVEESSQLIKYRCLQRDSSKALSWEQVLELWKHEDTGFLQAFRGALTPNRPMRDIFWECSPILNVTDPFEFVIMDANGVLDSRRASSSDFDAHLRDPSAVVVFKNLGGDATLVTPNRAGSKDEMYGHLHSFTQFAPLSQQETLWRHVAEQIYKQLGGGKPIWLSTDGRGVPWLHVRLDNHPKWYKYSQYRQYSVSHNEIFADRLPHDASSRCAVATRLTST